jgi:hypothetical protein
LTVQVPTYAKLHGRTLQGVAERGFHPVANVGLFALGAHIGFADPLAPDAAAQLTLHTAVGKDVVMVLPVLQAQDVVKPVLDHAGIDVGHCQGPAAADGTRLELHFGLVEGGRQGGHQDLDFVAGHGMRSPEQRG